MSDSVVSKLSAPLMRAVVVVLTLAALLLGVFAMHSMMGSHSDASVSAGHTHAQTDAHADPVAASTGGMALVAGADQGAVVPMVPTSTDFVQDLRRILELSAEGSLLPVDSIRLVPKDSGLRVVNLINLVRRWPQFPSTQPRALALRIGGEGAQPSELRFFSREAAPGLRPRLRITYLPRTQAALP